MQNARGDSRERLEGMDTSPTDTGPKATHNSGTAGRIILRIVSVWKGNGMNSQCNVLNVLRMWEKSQLGELYVGWI